MKLSDNMKAGSFKKPQKVRIHFSCFLHYWDQLWYYTWYLHHSQYQ